MNKKSSTKKLLLMHFRRRPLMRATDAYKLLYQGVFGVGHILGGNARLRLENEARSLNIEDHPEEPFIEVISPNGSMLRVNLRPYMRRGLPLDKLYSAMVETAKMNGDSKEFLEEWETFKGLVASGTIEIDAKEFDGLDEELKRDGPRPHHHSGVYRDAYYPAYRVVRRDYLESSLGSGLY
jgi:hypothetical protein